jgi:hypothetical protein
MVRWNSMLLLILLRSWRSLLLLPLLLTAICFLLPTTRLCSLLLRSSSALLLLRLLSLPRLLLLRPGFLLLADGLFLLLTLVSSLALRGFATELFFVALHTLFLQDTSLFFFPPTPFCVLLAFDTVSVPPTNLFFAFLVLSRLVFRKTTSLFSLLLGQLPFGKLLFGCLAALFQNSTFGELYFCGTALVCCRLFGRTLLGCLVVRKTAFGGHLLCNVVLFYLYWGITL